MSAERQATHARVIRIKGDPNKTDERIRNWTSQILPLIKKQEGFRGASFVGNRKTGEGLTVAYWDSEQAMKNARPRVRPEAEKILQGTGGEIVQEDECEVAVQERFKSPKAGVFFRVTTIEADPAKVDQGIANFRERVVPAVKQQPGARAAILLVNRQTGRSFSASGWDTEQDLKNSEAAVSGLRSDAIKLVGGKGTKVEAFEVYFTEIPALTAVG